MNVFDAHSRIVQDYATYIRSFLNIADPAIRSTVEQELSRGKLWPEPLLQFNPAYATAAAGYAGLLELRRLHVALDCAVLAAYGGTDLDLGHGFHAVETLPENDRIRYTISPAARKEVLRRLLALNLARGRRRRRQWPFVSQSKKVTSQSPFVNSSKAICLMPSGQCSYQPFAAFCLSLIAVIV